MENEWTSLELNHPNVVSLEYQFYAHTESGSAWYYRGIVAHNGREWGITGTGAHCDDSEDHNGTHQPGYVRATLTVDDGTDGYVGKPYGDAMYNEWWHDESMEEATLRALQSLLLNIQE